MHDLKTFGIQWEIWTVLLWRQRANRTVIHRITGPYSLISGLIAIIDIDAATIQNDATNPRLLNSSNWDGCNMIRNWLRDRAG